MERRTTLQIALALTILISGNSFVLVKLAVDDGASPIMIAAGRFILASTIFGVYILWKRPRWPERSDLRIFLILAFIGVGVYYFFQYLLCNEALKRIDKPDVIGKVPDYVTSTVSDFSQCPGCNKFYWKVTHYQNMLRQFHNLLHGTEITNKKV